MSGPMSEVSEKHSKMYVVTTMGPLLFDFQMDLPTTPRPYLAIVLENRYKFTL